MTTVVLLEVREGATVPVVSYYRVVERVPAGVQAGWRLLLEHLTSEVTVESVLYSEESNRLYVYASAYHDCVSNKDAWKLVDF